MKELQELEENLEEYGLEQNYVNINWTEAGDIGAKRLATVISKSKGTPERLDVSLNNIGYQGFQYLFEALTMPNSSLERLNVSGNDMGDKGCEYLSSFLLQNTSLKILNIS